MPTAAFPRPFSLDGETDVEAQTGMTLRQYYAGQALTGFISVMTPQEVREDPMKVARWCAMVADAMVTEVG